MQVNILEHSERLKVGCIPVCSSLKALGNFLADQVRSVSNIGSVDFVGLIFVLNIFRQATYSDRCVVDRARAWCSVAGTAYFRLSPTFAGDVALDCKDNAELVQMLCETRAYIHTHQEEFERAAQLLQQRMPVAAVVASEVSQGEFGGFLSLLCHFSPLFFIAGLFLCTNEYLIA